MATEEKLDLLKNTKVSKLLFKLAVPTIVAQIVNLLYMEVDRIMIGHIPVIGGDALTGVGVCLSVLIIVMSFSSLCSVGGASRAAIFLGKGDKESAEKTLGNCALALIISGLLMIVIFEWKGRELLLLFGASDITIDYAWDYMKIYALGALSVHLTLGLNRFITTQGFAKTSMLTVIIGAVLNLILDPLFIFVFNMGVKGAALATIISQTVSAIWVVLFLIGNKTVLKIKLKNFKLESRIILPALSLGLAPFIMNFTESILGICFNISLLKYGGDTAVGAMTIFMSLSQFIILPLIGLSQGAQPIMSYNKGAKLPERMKETLKLLLMVAMTYSFVIWGLIMITPRTFAQLFTDSEQIIVYVEKMIRVFLACGGLFSAQIVCQQMFVALGKAKESLFIALLRKVIILIPLIYIMPLIFTQNQQLAVLLAEPLADLISVIITVIFFGVVFKKELNSLRTQNQLEGVLEKNQN